MKQHLENCYDYDKLITRICQAIFCYYNEFLMASLKLANASKALAAICAFFSLFLRIRTVKGGIRPKFTFIGWKFSEDDETAELTIKCRDEDVAYTQKMLACFV